MSGWLILFGLIALAVLGPLFGADSRDGRDWRAASFPEPRRSPARPAGEPTDWPPAASIRGPGGPTQITAGAP